MSIHFKGKYSNYFINFKWSIIYKNIESLCHSPETSTVNQLYFK